MNKTAKLINKFEEETGISAKPIKKEYSGLSPKDKKAWKESVEDKLNKLREWKKQAKLAQTNDTGTVPNVTN